MSSSRGGGSGVTCSARSRSSSVVSPIAETTTTTSWPALRVLTMRCATRLMPAASATDEPPYFCTTMPTGQYSARAGVRPRSRAPGGPAEPAPIYGDGLVAVQHLIGRGDVLVLAGELGVQPVVGDHRQQRVERDPGQVAPRGDVGELPPPQRLLDVAQAVVAQPGLEVGGDAGEVVGELALDHLRDVGVEDVAVGVDAVEHLGQPQPHLVEVGLGADVGLVLWRGAKSRCAPSRAPASEIWLISSSSSEIARPASPSRAISRRASRKLEKESAISGRSPPSRWSTAFSSFIWALRLPANARPRVTSSAYSRSPPTGSPLASRVTARSRSFNIRVR